MDKKIMDKKKIKNFIIDILVDLISGLLVGAAYYSFAIHYDFPMTGVSGLALIVYHFKPVPIGTLTLILNIPIVLVCMKTLGVKFMVKSFRTMVIGTVAMDLIAPRFPVFQGETMLAALCVAVLTGFGYAIVYMRNTSTGGMDFVLMTLKARHPHISYGNLFFAVDVFVILLGGIIYKNVGGIIYGVLISLIASYVVDKVMMGADAGKMALVVTDNAQAVVDLIDRTCDRGSTILLGKGGYTGDDKQVVMVACSNKEMFRVRQAINEMDDRSFMVIMESKEVWGEGFKED